MKNRNFEICSNRRRMPWSSWIAPAKIQLVNAQTEKLFGYERGTLGPQVELLVPQRFHGEHSTHRDKYSHSPKPREMGAGLELYGRQ